VACRALAVSVWRCGEPFCCVVAYARLHCELYGLTGPSLHIIMTGAASSLMA